MVQLKINVTKAFFCFVSVNVYLTIPEYRNRKYNHEIIGDNTNTSIVSEADQFFINDHEIALELLSN